MYSLCGDHTLAADEFKMANDWKMAVEEFSASGATSEQLIDFGRSLVQHFSSLNRYVMLRI